MHIRILKTIAMVIYRRFLVKHKEYQSTLKCKKHIPQIDFEILLLFSGPCKYYDILSKLKESEKNLPVYDVKINCQHKKYYFTVVYYRYLSCTLRARRKPTVENDINITCIYHAPEGLGKNWKCKIFLEIHQYFDIAISRQKQGAVLLTDSVMKGLLQFKLVVALLLLATCTLNID